jgi:hypothetical protein
MVINCIPAASAGEWDSNLNIKMENKHQSVLPFKLI